MPPIDYRADRNGTVVTLGVDKHQAGLVFSAGNPKDFADKVLELYKNKDLRNQLGENGKKASMEGQLNWETTQRTLIQLYNTLLN